MSGKGRGGDLGQSLTTTHRIRRCIMAVAENTKFHFDTEAAGSRAWSAIYGIQTVALLLRGFGFCPTGRTDLRSKS